MKCKYDPDLFFDVTQEEAAKAICGGCPMRKACAELGATEEHGIWGGTDPIERAMARFRAATPQTQARDHEWDLVVELCAERGYTDVLAISKVTGVRADAVATRLGVEWVDNRAALVAELSAKGYGPKEIREKVGLSQRRIQELIKQSQAVAA
ncbi:WhiB family transcriptional regulator [Micromonospora sp. CB01531]|uniref:WhiB family transcriptional regulator n=1 Tax=Micromonospora sp. CB01531 TaxID=1718947 RepID=UPI00093A9B5B|nr:WhiB family transcriptional regulator [Micromonospora sp. CB01531]OKI45086.1 hypothetical protein A6A27_11745 [Micromonospora sp. CB01531]